MTAEETFRLLFTGRAPPAGSSAVQESIQQASNAGRVMKYVILCIIILFIFFTQRTGLPAVYSESATAGEAPDEMENATGLFVAVL